MKIKTNIYHITADNGQQYEDYTPFSVTIHAQNEEQAIRKGLDKISKDFFIDRAALTNGSAELVFANVEIEVPTPDPIQKDIGSNTVTYHYDRKQLEINSGLDKVSFDDKREFILLHQYLTELLKTLE